VRYFHLVFTLPHQLNPLAQGNPALIYALLFAAAADTLLEFARNPRWLGGEIAATLLLHTWSQTLIQQETPKEMLGRVSSSLMSLMAFSQVVSMFLAGPVADRVGIRNLYFGSAAMLLAADWPHAYSREEAAFPRASLRHAKYWSPVGRVDNVWGDRNLSCSCPPLASYED